MWDPLTSKNIVVRVLPTLVDSGRLQPPTTRYTLYIGVTNNINESTEVRCLIWHANPYYQHVCEHGTRISLVVCLSAAIPVCGFPRKLWDHRGYRTSVLSTIITAPKIMICFNSSTKC